MYADSIKKVNLIYNKYVSALSFESDIVEVYSEDALRNAREYQAK